MMSMCLVELKDKSSHDVEGMAVVDLGVAMGHYMLVRLQGTVVSRGTVHVA